MAYDPAISGGGYVSPNTIVLQQNGTASQAAFILYNDLKPFELLNLFQRNKNELSFRMLMRGMGFRRVVGSNVTGHYEVGKNIDLINVGSVISGGASPGVPVVIALTAGNMFTTTIGGVAAPTSFPAVNDEWELPTGERFWVSAKNTAVSPNQLTLVPLDATVQGNVVLTAGLTLRWVGTLYAEGTDTGVTRSARVIKYQNTFALPKASWSATGTAQTTEAYWNPVPGVAGAFTMRLNDEMMDRYNQDIDNRLIFGEQTTNLTQANATLGITLPITGTQGMISFISDYGFDLPIIPGQLSIQDFDDISNTLEGERVWSREYLALMGFNNYMEYENVFVDYAGRYNFQSGFSLTGTVKDDGYDKMTIDVGAFSLNKAGYKYVFKSFGAFNQNNGAGASGFPYKSYSVFTPLGIFQNKKDNTDQPICGYEVRGSNGYVREDQICMVDGTGRYQTYGGSSVDITTMGILSEIAGHWTCPNNMIIQRP
jgi:hypothetical protein